VYYLCVGRYCLRLLNTVILGNAQIGHLSPSGKLLGTQQENQGQMQRSAPELCRVKRGGAVNWLQSVVNYFRVPILCRHFSRHIYVLGKGKSALTVFTLVVFEVLEQDVSGSAVYCY
jgi:hypothetical protein